MQLGELERLVLAERQVAAALIAAGAEDLEAPVYAEVRAEFDFELEQEPVPESDRTKLLRKLGV